MNNNNLESLVKTAMEKIREMVDPITTPDGTTIIPVSKVSFGFASGGSDLPNKNAKDLFGGGSGAGVTIQPIAFITVSNGEVKLLQMSVNASTENAVINMIPDIVDKISAFIKKDKE